MLSLAVIEVTTAMNTSYHSPLTQSSLPPNHVFISDLGVRPLGITCSVENDVKDINP